MTIPSGGAGAAAHLPPRRGWLGDVSRGGWWSLASAALGWTFEVFDLALMALLLPVLIPALHLSKGGAGALSSASAGGAILGGLAIGWLADRVGRVKTLYGSILVYSAFTGLIFFSNTLPQLLALRFLGGLGMGGAWATGAALIAESWPERHRGKAGAVMQAGLPFGSILAVAAVARGSADHAAFVAGGWRWLFALGALPALLLLPVVLKTPESPVWLAERREVARGARGAYSGLFTPALLLALVFIFFVQFVFWAVSSWSPTFLVTIKHFTFAKSLGFTLLQQLGVLAGFMVLAAVVDRIGRRPTFLIYLVLGGVALTAFVLSNDRAVLLAANVGVGFGIGGVFGGLGPFTAELLGDTPSRAFGMSIAYNGGRLGGLVAPVLVGAFGRTDQGFQAGMLLSVAALAGAMVAVLLAPETKGVSLR